MYKIFINDIPLLITAKSEFPSHFEVRDKGNVKETASLISDLLRSNRSHRGIVICVNNERSFFKGLKDEMRYIKAAGGLVKNDADNTLFIFRNGKWDLPKGKMEEGEVEEECAMREVEEECGIKGLEIIRELPSTYHTYLLHGEVVLKRTYWYEMEYAGKEKLIPQIEEGITIVKWLDAEEVRNAMNNTYASIREIVRVLSSE